MNVDAQTIDEYFANTGERENDLRSLDKLIQKYAPNLTQVLFHSTGSSVIGYGVVPYQTKSMKEPGEWPLISIANQKNHMALYICALTNGEYIAEKYKDSLGKVSTGKSCIRFKQYSDLNTLTLRNILKDLNAQYLRGEVLYA